MTDLNSSDSPGANSVLHSSLVSLCQLLSQVRLFATPWTIAHQAPLSMEFSRQEYLSGLPCPSPGDLPYPGIEPRSPTLHSDSLPSEPRGPLASAGGIRDLGSIPGMGRSPGVGQGNPLQYSCLEKPMEREAWRGCKELDVTEVN